MRIITKSITFRKDTLLAKNQSIKVVWISGPTGSGKTTFASGLPLRDLQLIKEDVPSHLFEEFLQNPGTGCYKLQRSIIERRIDQIDAAISSGCTQVVLDRSPEEDLEVFCRMYRNLGYLNVTEYRRLEKLAKLSVKRHPPDVIVYLSAPLNILQTRLASEACPKLVLENLPQQYRLYDQWQRSKKNGIVLIDNSRADSIDLKHWIRTTC